MNANDVGEQLHDRATRGVELTAEEQAQLNEWYAQRDRAEAAVLSRPTSAQPLDALHAQVDRVMVQFGDVARRNQTLSAENDAVRKEIAELQRRLASKSAAQPARRSPTSCEKDLLAEVAAGVDSGDCTTTTETRPLTEITQSAIRLLCREMGVVSTDRFLNQFNCGHGNYTEERDQLFGHMTVAEIAAAIQRRRNPDAMP